MVAELKKIPFRRACSSFVYHNENRYTTPGKRPHSATPRKNRAAKSPDAFWAPAIAIMIPPHITMINVIHFLGPTSFKQMLDGTSKRTYLRKSSGVPKERTIRRGGVGTKKKKVTNQLATWDPLEIGF
jgi:hypothetical protein